MVPKTLDEQDNLIKWLIRIEESKNIYIYIYMKIPNFQSLQIASSTKYFK